MSLPSGGPRGERDQETRASPARHEKIRGQEQESGLWKSAGGGVRACHLPQPCYSPSLGFLRTCVAKTLSPDRLDGVAGPDPAHRYPAEELDCLRWWWEAEGACSGESCQVACRAHCARLLTAGCWPPQPTSGHDRPQCRCPPFQVVHYRRPHQPPSQALSVVGQSLSESVS